MKITSVTVPDTTAKDNASQRPTEDGSPHNYFSHIPVPPKPSASVREMLQSDAFTQHTGTQERAPAAHVQVPSTDLQQPLTVAADQADVQSSGDDVPASGYASTGPDDVAQHSAFHCKDLGNTDDTPLALAALAVLPVPEPLPQPGRAKRGQLTDTAARARTVQPQDDAPPADRFVGPRRAALLPNLEQASVPAPSVSKQGQGAGQAHDAVANAVEPNPGTGKALLELGDSVTLAERNSGSMFGPQKQHLAGSPDITGQREPVAAQANGVAQALGMGRLNPALSQSGTQQAADTRRHELAPQSAPTWQGETPLRQDHPAEVSPPPEPQGQQTVPKLAAEAPAGAGAYLQLPFNKGALKGHITVTKDAGQATHLQLSPSSREIASHLEGAMKPEHAWRLNDDPRGKRNTLPPPDSDDEASPLLELIEEQQP